MGERLFCINPAELEARLVARKLAELGSCARLIGNGDSQPQLGLVFRRSLLGDRLGIDVDREVLTAHEKELRTGDFKALAIIDMDGVMGSPVHAAGKFLSTPSLWARGLDGVKAAGRIPREDWRWLQDVVRAADESVLWTSRFSPKEESLGKYPFLRWIVAMADRGEGVTYFPFLTPRAVARLRTLGETGGNCKLAVQPCKSFRGGRAEALEKMCDRSSAGIIYYIGSSHFDRRAVLDLVRKRPDLAPKIVFFDTCHLVL